MTKIFRDFYTKILRFPGNSFAIIARERFSHEIFVISNSFNIRPNENSLKVLFRRHFPLCHEFLRRGDTPRPLEF
jgi:hypothetical protein